MFFYLFLHLNSCRLLKDYQKKKKCLNNLDSLRSLLVQKSSSNQKESLSWSLRGLQKMQQGYFGHLTFVWPIKRVMEIESSMCMCSSPYYLQFVQNLQVVLVKCLYSGYKNNQGPKCSRVHIVSQRSLRVKKG